MGRRDIIAIGGSTGAVDAVRQLCRKLPRDFPATLLIAIHVGARGNNLLAEIFAEEASITVSTAVDGDVLRHGHAYVAPADRHLLLIDGIVRLGRGPRENMSRPAIDPLFRSIGVCCGPRAIAVTLTGMLNDGASGLADIKRCGGITIVQNPEDAEEPDMPRHALEGSEVDYVAPLSEIPALLVRLSSEEAGAPVNVPSAIINEVEIALGQGVNAGITPAPFADLSALSCPACGGVLSQIRRGPPLRFRCQVGHAYTAEILVEEKEGAVDEAIRVALRIMEERVALTVKTAEEAHRSGRSAAALSLDQRLRESQSYVDILRQAIEKI